MGINETGLRIESEQRIGHPHGILLVPVGRDTGPQPSPALDIHPGKSIMTALGRCRTGEPAYLDSLLPLAEQMERIVCGRTPDSLIVHPDTGGIGITYDISVEDYHGQPALIDLPDHRRQLSRLVGRHNHYIETIVGEIADILDLAGIVVIGRTDLHNGLLVKHYLAIYLVVHLGAPVISATLRHTYFIYLLLGTSGGG